MLKGWTGCCDHPMSSARIIDWLIEIYCRQIRVCHEQPANGDLLSWNWDGRKEEGGGPDDSLIGVLEAGYR